MPYTKDLAGLCIENKAVSSWLRFRESPNELTNSPPLSLPPGHFNIPHIQAVGREYPGHLDQPLASSVLINQSLSHNLRHRPPKNSAKNYLETDLIQLRSSKWSRSQARPSSKLVPSKSQPTSRPPGPRLGHIFSRKWWDGETQGCFKSCHP